VFAAIGTLSTLVQAASLAFPFAVVSGLAFYVRAGARAVTGRGALLAGVACIALGIRLAKEDPVALAFLACLVLVAAVGRPWNLRYFRVENDDHE
jgi:hypothetical protein